MGAQAQPNLKGSLKLGSYLKKLRAGYGYSLRRVEERARAEGGEIDNSQLSRYEKGICYPSFDKLRVLASVFNVSIQSFSDVVDLEEFDELRPEATEPDALIAEGKALLAHGDHGRAFVYFETAIEALSETTPSPERQRLIAECRINEAAALHRLGKLSLAEQELRQAMRFAESISLSLRAKALLALATIHAVQGDTFLGEMESERAHALAEQADLPETAAKALHTLGQMLAHQGRPADAIERYREAARHYERCGNQTEAVRIKVNIGAAFVELGKRREGIRLLQAAVHEARVAGLRRIESLAWCNLGDAYFRGDDFDRARACFRESDALAVYNDERLNDVLFFNAYHEWKMAAADSNPTREKIAFGRLKALRSALESRFPEVDAFDAFVERGRSHA